MSEEAKTGKKATLTTLLFVLVTIAVMVKFAIKIEPLRAFFAGPGKFIFVPILLMLGYLGTRRH